jgi:hypothetical protein
MVAASVRPAQPNTQVIRHARFWKRVSVMVSLNQRRVPGIILRLSLSGQGQGEFSQPLCRYVQSSLRLIAYPTRSGC